MHTFFYVLKKQTIKMYYILQTLLGLEDTKMEKLLVYYTRSLRLKRKRNTRGVNPQIVCQMLERSSKTGSFSKKEMVVSGSSTEKTLKLSPGEQFVCPVVREELGGCLSKQRGMYGNVKQYDIFSKLSVFYMASSYFAKKHLVRGMLRKDGRDEHTGDVTGEVEKNQIRWQTHNSMRLLKVL